MKMCWIPIFFLFSRFEFSLLFIWFCFSIRILFHSQSYIKTEGERLLRVEMYWCKNVCSAIQCLKIDLIVVLYKKFGFFLFLLFQFDCWSCACECVAYLNIFFTYDTLFCVFFFLYSFFLIRFECFLFLLFICHAFICIRTHIMVM